MTLFWVEPSRENLPLALAELSGAVEANRGREAGRAGTGPELARLAAVELEDRAAAARLGRRLALARRVLEPLGPLPLPELEARFRHEGSQGRSAALRPLGRPGAALGGGAMDRCARAYVGGGGRIDLESPERRFYLVPEEGQGWWAAEEVAAIDRHAFSERRMPALPFRRPVSLPPKLGRVAVNLAAVRPGDRVIDPFVGTGALLLEAALLGAKVSGVDRDAEMVRGAVRNLSHLGLEFERLVVADAGDASELATGAPWDAVVTDPPYGRSSGSGGEPPADLVRRVLPRWAEQVRPGGRVVVVLPGGPDPLDPPWECLLRIPDRVHRSLTREFRVYRRTQP